MPLLTINIHLGSRDCSQVLASSIRQCTEETTAQQVGAHPTTTHVVPPPAGLQLQHPSSDVPAGNSEHVADPVQHAAMHVTVSEPLLPDTDCGGSALLAEGSGGPSLNEPVIPVHASKARPSSHQAPDTLQAATLRTKHLFLVPHAELVGEYRIPDFVTAQEEVDIVRMLDTTPPPWKDSSFNGKHRYHHPNSTQCGTI